MGKLTLAIGATLFFIIWAVTSIVANVNYNISVGGYLERAANANSVELAAENLSTAITKIEANRWTSGNTGVLWVSPQNDLGFWYQNLTSARDELTKLDPAATPLEKTNVLMKLRESLISGDSVTAPEWIWVYPRNALFFWWGWGSGLLALGLWIWQVVRLI